MQRKSNKTAHVLSLLTSDKKEPSMEEEQPKPDSLQLSPNDADKQTKTKIDEVEKPIPMPEPQKLVSELIKDSLLKEFQEDEPEQPNIIPAGSYEDEIGHTEKKAPSVKTLEFENFDSPVPNEEIDYIYINVTEKMVREMAPEYMDKFGVCRCNRCVVDTIALTLTNLPPKYIVTDKNKLSPLLNFYSTKFTAAIVAQITKACMTVNAFPHHNNKEQ